MPRASRRRADAIVRAPELFSLADRVAVVTGGIARPGPGDRARSGRGGRAGGDRGAPGRVAGGSVGGSRGGRHRGTRARVRSHRPRAGRAADRWRGAAFGRLDILVNNAGVSWGGPFEEMPLDRWRQVFETNVGGVFLATRAALPPMKARGYGKIINIASVRQDTSLPAYPPARSSSRPRRLCSCGNPPGPPCRAYRLPCGAS